jgi:hypothetical protein
LAEPWGLILWKGWGSKERAMCLMVVRMENWRRWTVRKAVRAMVGDIFVVVFVEEGGSVMNPVGNTLDAVKRSV